jgi:hypothetical protein
MLLTAIKLQFPVINLSNDVALLQDILLAKLF